MVSCAPVIGCCASRTSPSGVGCLGVRCARPNGRRLSPTSSTFAKGTARFVTSLQPGLLMEALGFIVDYHRDDNVLLFHEVPRILEPAATAMAATSMPDADVVPAGRLLHKLGDNPASQISWRRPRVPPADRRRLRYSGALVAGRESFRSHAAGAEGGAG